MNIYIAGLSYRTNDADLTNLFAEFGEVSSAKVIMDRETGKSRGFAFVEMSNDEEGQKAIDELNGVEYPHMVEAVEVVTTIPEDINIRTWEKQKEAFLCFSIKSLYPPL